MNGTEMRDGAQGWRTSLHVVAQPLGTGTVLIHLETNQIYELNRTGRRIWELIAAGLDRAAICARMEEEFDVSPEQAEREIGQLLTLLQAEQLIVDR